MKRVVVTGATGFIGRQSLKPLLELGYEVHALCTREPIDVDPRIQWHTADLLRDGAAANLCSKIQPTHLLHFAWYVNPKDYKISPENKRWVGATLDLLKAFRESGGTRATLAGTCMEYDWSISRDRLPEDASLAPPNPYSLAKQETRLLAEAYAAKSGFDLAWGRIFFLYGPHEARERLVAYVITALLAGEPALCSPGEQVRDYSHVSDIAGAFAALLDSLETGPVNIGSGTGIALKDMLHVIGDIMGKRELIRLGARPSPQNEPQRVVADTSRLSSAVGWRPRFNHESGLRETIAWWKVNRE